MDQGLTSAIFSFFLTSVFVGLEHLGGMTGHVVEVDSHKCCRRALDAAASGVCWCRGRLTHYRRTPVVPAPLSHPPYVRVSVICSEQFHTSKSPSHVSSLVYYF
jgi:hypothetical protein